MGAMTLVASFLGCSGSPTTPRTPLPDVRPEPNQPAPASPASTSTTPAPASTGTPNGAESLAAHVRPFVDAIAERAPNDVRRIAVFPPVMVNSLHGDRLEVRRSGEEIAKEIIRALRSRRFTVLGLDDLTSQLIAANRSLADYRAQRDVHYLAERLDADLVVFGTDEKRGEFATERLHFDLTCARIGVSGAVADGQVIIRPGSIGREVDRWRSEAARIVKIGELAPPPSNPDPDLEMRIVARILARRLAAKVAFGGTRVMVTPTTLPATLGATLRQREMERTFVRQIAAAERAVGEGKNRTQRALQEAGDYGHGSQRFKTLDAFLDAIRQARIRLSTTRAGQYGASVAAMIGQILSDESGNRAIVNLPDDKELMVSWLRREVDLGGDRVTDRETIAAPSVSGARFLVASEISKGLSDYSIRITAIDLTGATPNERIEEALPPFCARALEQAFSAGTSPRG